MQLLASFYLIVISTLLTFLLWAIIIHVILGWLVAFNVVNPHNQLVSIIGRFTHALTEPLLAPIRSVMPSLGGIDLSPLILILLINFIDYTLTRYFYQFV